MNDQTHIELLEGRIEAIKRDIKVLKDLVLEYEKQIEELEKALKDTKNAAHH